MLLPSITKVETGTIIRERKEVMAKTYLQLMLNIQCVSPEGEAAISTGSEYLATFVAQ